MTENETPGPKVLALGALASALIAIAVLYFSSGFFQPEELHIYGQRNRLNDQAGYITTARILAETGELRGGLIYPSYVDNPRSRLYMPGHYASLALSYLLFGYGAFTSLLPNLISFVVGAAAVFLIGARLYGVSAGMGASFLFAIFPANVTYAFTAMAELTFIAAVLVAFCGFVFLRSPWRYRLAPILLAIPFLFRETGALFVLPMVLFALVQKGRGLRVAALTLVASVVVLGLINSWQLASGKESTPLSWVTEGGFNYNDAVPPAAPDLSPGEWLSAIARTAETNHRQLWARVFESFQTFEAQSLAFLLVLFAVATLIGAWSLRRDPLPLGAGLVGCAMFLMTLCLYDVVGFKGLRASLAGMPLCAVAVCGSLFGARWFREARFGPLGRRVGRALVFTALAALASWWSHDVIRRGGNGVVRKDLEARANTTLIESLQHDDERMLVAPEQLSLDYVVRHYPVRWSFVPANPETFDRLRARFDIGTFVLPVSYLKKLEWRASIGRAGLQQTNSLKDGRGGEFVVFRH